jgi:hypothetical protein
MGVWVLCGTYACDHLTDGFVPNEVFEDYGGSKIIRGFLVGAGFVDEVDGGVIITAQHCRIRSATAVQSERKATAKRVQRHRNGADLGNKPDVTPLHDRCTVSGLGSGLGNRSSPSQEPVVTYRGMSPAAQARELVQAALSGLSYVGRKERRALDGVVLELLGDGAPADVIAEALGRWVKTEDVYAGHLPHMVTEIMKRRAGPVRSRNGHEPLSGMERSFAKLEALDAKYAAEAVSPRGEIE